MTHKLTYPLPARDSVRTSNGWASTPWTEERVREAVLGGGWFSGARFYDFADNRALQASRFLTNLLG